MVTDSPLINVSRVRNRILKGGHAVPEDKITSRYFRSLNLLTGAINETYRSFIFDNSGNRHQLILEIFNGSEIIIHTDKIPNWVQEYVIEKMV